VVLLNLGLLGVIFNDHLLDGRRRTGFWGGRLALRTRACRDFRRRNTVGTTPGARAAALHGAAHPEGTSHTGAFGTPSRPQRSRATQAQRTS